MKKTVVITGASSGIGKATAKAFLKAKWNVIGISRTPCDLPGVENIKCDITNDADVKEAFSKIDRIDLLVNNAGFGISGAVEFTDSAEIERQFKLNFVAQVAVSNAAMPALKKSKGKIIFVSSAAAVFSIPFQSFYSATKASIEILAAAMRNELKPFGVKVACVRLGDIKTGFTAARETSYKGDDVYKGQIARAVAVMAHDEQNGMSPDDVAKVILKLAKKRRMPLVTTIGIQYKLVCALAKVLPLTLVNFLVGKIYLK